MKKSRDSSFFISIKYSSVSAAHPICKLQKFLVIAPICKCEGKDKDEDEDEDEEEDVDKCKDKEKDETK